ncbi:MAG: HD-GYP domain-containing protein [Firmicutes bacterium]|jgi:HD-GYP domain-containing protein (c-di-GMP phosphodiesterase class II)|nr:HD-GYP domain-containing protein [Bacillota bacterium]
MKNNMIYGDIIHCLVNALEAKDRYTSGHSTRVGDMCQDFGKILDLEDDMVELIHMSGHLHDIGKIGIPDWIINKTGGLDDSEWSIMKSHPVIGHDIIKESEYLKDISKNVLYHHERWDGHGYPNGLSKHEIPLGARVIAICDSIDAMMSKRAYRDAYDWNYAKKEVLKNSGSQFDPNLVNKMEPLWEVWTKRYS